MPKFTVFVEKRLYSTGSIVVDAENAKQARNAVDELIRRGKLQTTEIKNWDGHPEDEDCSFATTGRCRRNE
jgi:hypothetical protein